MTKSNIIFPGSFIHPFYLINGPLIKKQVVQLGNKGMKKGQRKKEGLGMDKKQFYSLLDKESKLFKKPEKRKS